MRARNDRERIIRTVYAQRPIPAFKANQRKILSVGAYLRRKLDCPNGQTLDCSAQQCPLEWIGTHQELFHQSLVLSTHPIVRDDQDICPSITCEQFFKLLILIWFFSKHSQLNQLDPSNNDPKHINHKTCRTKRVDRPILSAHCLITISNRNLGNSSMEAWHFPSPAQKLTRLP